MGLRKLIWDVYPNVDKKDEALRQRVEAEFIAVYEREFLRNPQPFEGVREFLWEWEGRLAIVSNKRARFIHPILEKLDLHKLPWVRIVGGDTYPNMKPHPEPFLGAIDAAGATPEETWIIGDGSPDVEGALAIGSLCVAVEFGYQPVDQLMALGAWKSVSSFADLATLLRS
jgi:phosphoglycolate phosphatase-like HAD superfamily hydrolase